MKSISEIGASETLKEFAQGAAQESIQPVAGFLAPTVSVSSITGQYKKYTEKSRFRIPTTLRAVGGRAAELYFEAQDETFNCKPHALDFPVDNIQADDENALEDALREGAVSVAEVASLAHEKTVVDKALETVGAGTNKTWNSSADPVADIDEQILNVIKAAAYGSLMGVGVLFGAGAWQKFKNATNVRGRFIVGKGGNSALAVPTLDGVGDLFVSKPEVKASFMVYDTAPEGKAASMSFVLNDTVLIFARKQNPTRRDPSFMKTFRLVNRFMVPGTYEREDGRVVVAKFDWSEDVKVTNSAAAVRLNIA